MHAVEKGTFLTEEEDTVDTVAEEKLAQTTGLNTSDKAFEAHPTPTALPASSAFPESPTDDDALVVLLSKDQAKESVKAIIDKVKEGQSVTDEQIKFLEDKMASVEGVDKELAKLKKLAPQVEQLVKSIENQMTGKKAKKSKEKRKKFNKKDKHAVYEQCEHNPFTHFLMDRENCKIYRDAKPMRH